MDEKQKKLVQDALNYHTEGRPGKLEVIPTKRYATQRDLSLAYSPGVAYPCLEIEKNPDDVYKYTNKGNLVAVISNGTAVLGLGDIGTEAGKPVMEGKGLLFKVFSGIDVFDIEVTTKNIDEFVCAVKQISPTFGGINLEDIKAPECFEIEKQLVEALDIPVMHDDQHGTAIISNAGLLNALVLSNKKIEDVKVVVNGAGASAMACTKLMISLGAKKENVVMVDSKGVLHVDRVDMNIYKKEFATTRNVHTLEEAMKDADVFYGLSKGNILSKDMIKSMAPNCIVFAMANPDPEITYEDATDARKDIIMATGRSDYPNQVNNVLGFPFIFRGALDVRAKKINEEMKKAAVYALAELAREAVPEEVAEVYGLTNLTFGKEYIIPKPFDRRLITHVSAAVAKAAMDSGVARTMIEDWDAYKLSLEKLMGYENQIIRTLRQKASQNLKKVVFAEGANFRVIKAAVEFYTEKLGIPVLLGNKKQIKSIAEEFSINLDDIEIIDHLKKVEKREEYAKLLWEKRKRKGLTMEEAKHRMRNHNYFASMMVEQGDADAMVSGYTSKYKDVAGAALRVIGARKDIESLAGMYIVFSEKGTFFFGDTTVTPDPDCKVLASNAKLIAEEVKKFGKVPVVAMLSYSNFGAVSNNRTVEKVRAAVTYLHENNPDLIVDGDIQANIALDMETRDELFPFTKLKGHEVNTLIFPSLSSGNISYKLMQTIGSAELVGPILLGLNKPVQIVPIKCSVKELVNMAMIAAVESSSKVKI
ncbi:MAG: NADP-dependent malic enzyme [Bacteroidales bacterium]|nr:NADP-dependent malic enzyme [Bacteroidales bacterium]